MTDIDDVIDRYLAVWNEPDPAARRTAIEALWHPDAVYTNASSEYRGHDAIATGVATSHDKWVGSGHRFERGRADTHHDVVRLVWHMHGPDGGSEPVAVGTNFITVDGAGRIVADHQFLDR